MRHRGLRRDATQLRIPAAVLASVALALALAGCASQHPPGQQHPPGRQHPAAVVSTPSGGAGSPTAVSSATTTAPPSSHSAIPVRTAVVRPSVVSHPSATTARPAPRTVALTSQQPAATPAACTPLTNGGNCYEPGEFCRTSDHGASGIAGDGERITCEDNNGWRWEPSG